MKKKEKGEEIKKNINEKWAFGCKIKYGKNKEKEN